MVVMNLPISERLEELRRVQDTDAMLQNARRAAEGEPSTAGGGFNRRIGVLYRSWIPRGLPVVMSIDQIVLPQSCRPSVLHVAQTIPLAGHLGRNKTMWRIMNRCYWSTLFRDIALLQELPGMSKVLWATRAANTHYSPAGDRDTIRSDRHGHC